MEKYFQGSLRYLQEIRDAVTLPLLRKDFIVDPLQIQEAAEWGADAVLLIVSILTPALLADLLTRVKATGLAALVEVHDEAELEIALASGAEVIGINNRDLKTFTVDLGTSERLARKALVSGKPPLVLVAESGIKTGADTKRLRAAGVNAILVGETLMREEHLAEKVKELIGQ